MTSLVEIKMDKEYVDKLVYWIKERELIRYRRADGVPAPWTEDPIMQRFHFCNVHREHDRGTIELHAVRAKYEVDYEELPLFYTAARLFNKAETLEVYWKGGLNAVDRLRALGGPIFHTAYVVSTCGAKMDKVDYVHRVIEDVGKLDITEDNCQKAFEDLRQVDGLGSFLCGQIVADLKYTPYLDSAPDWCYFAVMGPGSKKGLDYLFGGGTTENNFHDRLVFLRSQIEHRIPPMHNQDLQNCLCEFSKYIRYLTDARGRRRPYNANARSQERQ